MKTERTTYEIPTVKLAQFLNESGFATSYGETGAAGQSLKGDYDFGEF